MNAPVSMMPSRAMFTTPERSHIMPPSAANVRGVAVMSVMLSRLTGSSCCRNSVMTRGVDLALSYGDGLSGSTPKSKQEGDDRRRGHEDDDERLDDRDEVGGD